MPRPPQSPFTLYDIDHLLTDEDHEQRHPAQGEGRWGEAMRHEQYLRAGKGKRWQSRQGAPRARSLATSVCVRTTRLTPGRSGSGRTVTIAQCVRGRQWAMREGCIPQE